MADRRRDLQHRLHQLGVDARLELVPADVGEHGVDVLHEVERLAVEQHVLLFDAERVRIALPEGVVEHAAAGGEPAPLAGDRRGIDLAHGRTLRMPTTRGNPTKTVASIFATNWPLTRPSFAVPKARTMKTSESSGVETRFVPTTRVQSGTRSRAQAPITLSVVSEIAKAASDAPTIRHVDPRTWSKCWPGNAGVMWAT